MTASQPPQIPDDAGSDVANVAPLSTWTETERAEALARFHMIRPFLEEGVPLSVLARQHVIPLRTMQHWVRVYRNRGLTALCRKPRCDKGHRRALPAELIQVVEGLALQKPRPSVAIIHRRLVEITAQKGLQAPSYDMVHDIVHQMDPALLTLAHEGSKVYGDTFELLYRREAAAPNDIWQADHTLLDIVVTDDKGQAKKPWLTVIMDDYSRAVAGYLLSFDAPSALQTSLALRQAIWRKAEPAWQVCGIPAVWYTDHGSDFTSKHLEQVCLDLQIRAIFSQVGKPRGRGRIERFFNTVNQMLLARLPGYAPSGFAAEAKPGLDLPGLRREFEALFCPSIIRPLTAPPGSPPNCAGTRAGSSHGCPNPSNSSIYSC